MKLPEQKPSLKRIGLGVAGLFVLAAIFGGGAKNQQTPTPNVNGLLPSTSQQTPATQSEASDVQATEVKSESTVTPIPFETTTQNDSSLDKGVTKVAVQGVNGEMTHVFQVTYTNGVETGRQELMSTVSKQPVNQVTLVGTKVAAPVAPRTTTCSSGYYLNSAGNCVQSPGSSPSGATARCRDGSYSYSQSRSGTCSHHGGVAAWL